MKKKVFIISGGWPFSNRNMVKRLKNRYVKWELEKKRYKNRISKLKGTFVTATIFTKPIIYSEHKLI